MQITQNSAWQNSNAWSHYCRRCVWLFTSVFPHIPDYKNSLSQRLWWIFVHLYRVLTCPSHTKGAHKWGLRKLPRRNRNVDRLGAEPAHGVTTALQRPRPVGGAMPTCRPCHVGLRWSGRGGSWAEMATVRRVLPRRLVGLATLRAVSAPSRPGPVLKAPWGSGSRTWPLSAAPVEAEPRTSLMVQRVKTPRCQCGVQGFDPWWGNWDPTDSSAQPND